MAPHMRISSIGTIFGARMRGAVLIRTALAILAISVTSVCYGSEVDFSGKAITIIIPSGVGGGTDAMARLAGRFLSERLPGKPSVIFQNMPGAGGISALNYFVRQAAPDGMTSIVGSAANIDPTTLRNPAVLYNPKSLQMFGGFPAPDGLLILRKDAVGKFNGKSGEPAIMGGEDNGVRTSDQMGIWGPNYLGWKVRWVVGYPGSSEILLAAVRGEIDLLATYDDSIIRPLQETGKFVYPAQLGLSSNGKLIPSSRFPDVPVFEDLMRPHLESPLEIQAFTAWQALADIGKWLALPPGAGPDMVAAYRAAFTSATSDPEFRSEASKILGSEFTVASGEETARMTSAADSISRDQLLFLDQLKRNVGVTALVHK
jgi:hypothetical protein